MYFLIVLGIIDVISDIFTISLLIELLEKGEKGK